jgi:hypothetical protein
MQIVSSCLDTKESPSTLQANCSIPVLCVARNVACNVRGGFFKDFDEGLLPRISNVFYEDEINEIPSAPDVGNYLISEVKKLVNAMLPCSPLSN